MSGRAYLLAAGSAFVLAFGSQARAQTTIPPTEQPLQTAQEEQASEEGVSDVIVTAQRRQERLQEVPVAVSTVSQELLTRASTNTISSLQLLVPSVQINTGPNARASGVEIRGVGTYSNSSGVEPSVATVIDGVTLARQGAAVSTDFNDIERIEVLRGPQGTLFGKNATAGVINVISQRPTTTLTGRADGLIAEQGEYQARATVSGPISDSLGFRLSGFSRRRGGYLENLFDGEDINGEKAWGVRGKLAFESGPFSATLIGDYSKLTGDCCALPIRTLSPTSPRYLAYAPAVPGYRNDKLNFDGPLFQRNINSGVSLEANLELPFGATLTFIPAYRHWTGSKDQDLDLVAGPPLGTGGQANRYLSDFSIEKHDQRSLELRLTSRAGSRLDYVLGLYYFDLDISRNATRLRQVPDSAVVQGVGFDLNFRSKSYAAYGQVDYAVTDALTLILGGRYTRDEFNYDYVRSNPSGAPGVFTGAAFVPVTLGEPVDADDFSVKAGVKYKFSEAVNTYFTYSQGYKGPGVSSDLQASPLDPIIQPETVEAFEGGIKTELFNRRLRLNLAVFNAEYSNFQLQTFDVANNRYVTGNAAEVRTRGVELDFNARLGRLTLGGGAAYVDAIFSEYRNVQCYAGQTPAQGCVLVPGTTTFAQNLSGESTPRSPDFKLVGNGEYVVPLGAVELVFDSDYTWQDAVQLSTTLDPVALQKGYGIWNAGVALRARDDRWQLRAFVKNITDQFYVVRVDNLQDEPSGRTHLPPRDAFRYFGLQGSVRF
jgi:iron complex outermembrane recepter protein